MPRRRPLDSDHSGSWPVVDGTVDGGRDTGEHEVSIPRRRRFAPLSTDGDLATSGGLPVTGPVSRPGSTWAATTGPLPAFRDSSAPADELEMGRATPPDGTLGAGGRDATESFSSPAASGPFSSPPASGPFSSPGASGSFGSPGASDAFGSSPASGSFGSPGASGSFGSPGAADPFSSPASGSFSSPTASGPLSPPAASGPLSSPSSTGPLSSPLSSPGSTARSPSGVVVPPAAEAEEQNRLPIFEAVESDWFRHVRRVVSTPNQPQENGNGSWASPADQGWQAAQAVHAPASAGVTPAGLPKRVPKANLVPGTAATPAVGQAGQAAASARSAAATRDRFASYQRGVLRGRAAASGAGSDGGEDKTSDDA